MYGALTPSARPRYSGHSLFSAAFALTIPARAGAIVLTVPSYDSPDGYDFVTTFPSTGLTTIGTF